jgi:hypothetical protein
MHLAGAFDEVEKRQGMELLEFGEGHGRKFVATGGMGKREARRMGSR